jgi:hypothetical protein
MSAIHFGVVIPYGSARQAAELAHIAEETGWDGVFVGDAIWTEDPLIRLTAAAMTTQRIKLGTMVLPAPLRIPWTLAGQALALDRLSEGRLILGMGTGATWMGWNWFPGVVTNTRERAEMLDETIDILTQLFQRKPFDFEGKHFQVKLKLSDPVHFPPPSFQKPRVPIWVPGVWGKKKSMQRVLKCDGIFPTKMDSQGNFIEITPADLVDIKAFVSSQRTLEGPFSYVIEGRTGGLGGDAVQEKLGAWAEAGMNWWVESTWTDSEEQFSARIRQGPPGLS